MTALNCFKQCQPGDIIHYAIGSSIFEYHVIKSYSNDTHSVLTNVVVNGLIIQVAFNKEHLWSANKRHDNFWISKIVKAKR